MMKLSWKGASRRYLYVGFFLLFCIMVSNLAIYYRPYIRPQLTRFSETGRYSDVANPRHTDFTVEHASTEESNAGHTRYEETVQIYRQVESNIYYNKQYSLALLRQLSTQTSGKTEKKNLKGAIEDVKHYFRVQVRRTDKVITETLFVKLEEYMEAVDDFYNDLELRGTKDLPGYRRPAGHQGSERERASGALPLSDTLPTRSCSARRASPAPT
ncbi:uncharacterized protein LOC125042179 isoform X2 [Penaeus chinensis]|uniref:uncharacterized protein LOC125042179 isoform X2 n=1 Tax=Penaeus chinensis TaxID=139456 RepID=UPI001FB81BA4|nr:uncharacterized protein LOC125042179 isoform X2 [Penaeus chinensis]